MFRRVNCTEYWCINGIGVKSFYLFNIRICISRMQPVGVSGSPMPVSGGCPALEAITGAAFAPMAVAGGVSILAYGEWESSRRKAEACFFFPPEWGEFCPYLNLINLNESRRMWVIRWRRRDGDRGNMDNEELRETIWGFLPPSAVLLRSFVVKVKTMNGTCFWERSPDIKYFSGAFRRSRALIQTSP